MPINSTLDNASVTEQQLGFKTNLLNSNINKKLFKTYYTINNPLDEVLPFEQLKENDMLFNGANKSLWSYRPRRINHTILDVTNIDEANSLAYPTYVLSSPSFTTIVDETGTDFNFRSEGDKVYIIFKNIDLLVGTGTFQPSYLELEYTDINNPDGFEQNKQFLSNIVLSVSVDSVDYDVIGNLFDLQSKPFINLITPLNQYLSQNIVYLKIECVQTLPTILQDKTFKLKNLKFVGYPEEGDWIEIISPTWFNVKKYTDTGVIPVVDNEIILTSDDLPYAGFYDVDFYSAIVDYQDPAGAIRIQTSIPHLLQFWDENTTEWMTVDSSPQFTPLGTPEPFYNNSVQGSRIVKSEVIGGKNKVRFRIYTAQPTSNFSSLTGTYYSITYMGKTIY